MRSWLELGGASDEEDLERNIAKAKLFLVGFEFFLAVKL